MSRIRLLPYGSADGAWNMAADEVLLTGAAGGVASLRFYSWDEATVSLGYFQESVPVAAHPRLAALPLVRRASGGAALVHDREITYALALPAVAPWLDRRGSWLRRIHQLICDVLAQLGARGRLCAQEKLLGPILCFLHHTPEDLLLGECKVVGSAQRKQRDALLQHGGILLAQSPATPELPGIAELTGITVDPVHLQEAVTHEIASRFGWDIYPDDWSSEERDQILARVQTRYRTPEWNLRR